MRIILTGNDIRNFFRPCTFSQHALCASEIIDHFDWSDREQCPIACESETFHRTSIEVPYIQRPLSFKIFIIYYFWSIYIGKIDHVLYPVTCRAKYTTGSRVFFVDPVPCRRPIGKKS